MDFPKADTFPQSIIREHSMGPNPLKLCEELLGHAEIPAGSVVLDLGSGAGLTSALMARECGFTVYAADLWSDPSDNMRFFEEMGLTNRQAVPLKEDATALPFAHGFFDAVVSVDSYNYFGRDPLYLGEHLLPLVSRGGELLFAIPGMARDCHDDLPACLLASWTPEQLDYMHDMAWWRANLEQTGDAEILDMREMTCTHEAWADWLECDNEYAAGDRAAVEAGDLTYLNTTAVRYPSSTTLLVLDVMPTLAYQTARRTKSIQAKVAVAAFVAAFSVLMVAGRLFSGVHWATDIVGSILLAAGLFTMYRYAVARADARLATARSEG